MATFLNREGILKHFSRLGEARAICESINKVAARFTRLKRTLA